MASLEIVFERNEIAQNIPYAFICETRYGAVWDTMRRKRRWVQEFTAQERRQACALFARAHCWYLGSGLPETVRMSAATYALWQKLAAFAGSL